MVDGLFFCATLTGRRGSHARLYKQERKRPTLVERRSSRTVRPLCIPLMIRPLRRTYVVVVRWTEEMCGVYKWVSRFEPPCICTWWTGELWVEQMSRLYGTTRWRECGCTATKLSRLDVCKGWKVICWCTTQASSHNSQEVVDGGVDGAGMSTRQEYSAVKWNRAGVAVRRVVAPAPQPGSSRSQQAASGVQRVMPASCEVTQGVGDTHRRTGKHSTGVVVEKICPENSNFPWK